MKNYVIFKKEAFGRMLHFHNISDHSSQDYDVLKKELYDFIAIKDQYQILQIFCFFLNYLEISKWVYCKLENWTKNK